MHRNRAKDSTFRFMEEDFEPIPTPPEGLSETEKFNAVMAGLDFDAIRHEITKETDEAVRLLKGRSIQEKDDVRSWFRMAATEAWVARCRAISRGRFMAAVVLDESEFASTPVCRDGDSWWVGVIPARSAEIIAVFDAAGRLVHSADFAPRFLGAFAR